MSDLTRISRSSIKWSIVAGAAFALAGCVMDRASQDESTTTSDDELSRDSPWYDDLADPSELQEDLAEQAAAQPPVLDPGEAPVDEAATEEGLLIDAQTMSTPLGPMPRSCVHEVPEDAVVDDDDNVTLPNGSTYSIPPCDLPIATSVQDPAVHGWVEAGWWHTDASVRGLRARWRVPHEPKNSDSQLIYLFPSLEPANYKNIIQPVLQWGKSPIGGRHYWALADWRVGKQGYIHSKLRRVYAGDLIRGKLFGKNCQGSSCTRWDIIGQDVTRNKRVRLAAHHNNREYHEVQGGVLEAYGVNQCGDFPRSNTFFGTIRVHNMNKNLMSPNFDPSYWKHTCDVHVAADHNSVKLQY